MGRAARLLKYATVLAVVQAKAASIVRAVIIMGSAVVGTVTVAQATAPTDIAVIPALPMSTGCAAQVISCVMGIAVGPLRADAAPAVAPTNPASVVRAVVKLGPAVLHTLTVARSTAATDIAVVAYLIHVSVGFATTTNACGDKCCHGGARCESGCVCGPLSVV